MHETRLSYKRGRQTTVIQRRPRMTPRTEVEDDDVLRNPKAEKKMAYSTSKASEEIDYGTGNVELTPAAHQTDTERARESLQNAKSVEWNFWWMCMLFGANHGCVVSCLSLATDRFDSVGAWQTAILYFTYTGSAIFGATGVVKVLGGRDALVAGMGLYFFYVAAFLAATLLPEYQREIAYFGAGLGGIGAGFLWTAQGSYFTVAAAVHAQILGEPLEQSTNKFGATFAFYYLAVEVILKVISSLTGSIQGLNWTIIFAVYMMVALVTTIGMTRVQKYEDPQHPTNNNNRSTSSSDWLERSTATIKLMINDTKMKYMIGMNLTFGFASALLNSYVNGQVVDVVFSSSNMIGIMTAWVAIVAALLSKAFAPLANIYGKGTILIFGSLCFAFVAIPFVAYPNVNEWGPIALLFVYTMHGAGRATFEGTLKAVFVDFFSYEKEGTLIISNEVRCKEGMFRFSLFVSSSAGAFANIILQNGLASALGYVLSSGFSCSHKSLTCIEFHDGTLHNLVPFEWLVIGSAFVGIVGFLVASSQHEAEVSDGRFTSLPQEETDDRSQV